MVLSLQSMITGFFFRGITISNNLTGVRDVFIEVTDTALEELKKNCTSISKNSILIHYDTEDG
jgi:hypothetical protein